jgi:hypothetical protein
MIRTRSARALGGLIVTLGLVFATGAYAAVIKRFSGETSQHQSISFRVAHGYVTHMQFRILDKCPSGRVWQIHDYGFDKIHINRFHKFDQLFSSKKSNATARISGKVRRKRVTGRLTERRFIDEEHHFCNGSATFALTAK